MSRPRRLRSPSCLAASRMTSRRCSRSARAAARSSALGSSLGGSGQKPRLQIGEPRRHHEVVGGKLEAQATGLLDEGQVLLGERQDRDPVKVHLLAPREFQQQIEGALEAVHVHEKRGLALGALGRRNIVEGESFCHHATQCARFGNIMPPAPAPHPIALWHPQGRKAPVRAGCAARRRRPGGGRRLRGSAASATAVISSILPLQ